MKNKYDIFGFSHIYKKWQMKCFTRSFHQAKTFFVKYETTTSITEILWDFLYSGFILLPFHSYFKKTFYNIKFFSYFLVTCGNYKFRIVTSILQSTFILPFAIAKETFGISRAGSRNLLKKFSSLKKKKEFLVISSQSIYVLILTIKKTKEI